MCHMICNKQVDVKSADDFEKAKKMGIAPPPKNQYHAPKPHIQVANESQPPQQTSPIEQMMPPQPAGVYQRPHFNAESLPPMPEAKPTESSSSSHFMKDEFPKTKIFVGGLDFNLTNEQLKTHFTKFGPVVDATILKDQNTGKSRGFGFVSFESEEVA